MIPIETFMAVAKTDASVIRDAKIDGEANDPNN